MDQKPEDNVATLPRANAHVRRKAKVDSTPFSYVRLYRAAPSDRIAMIKGGLEASVAKIIMTYISGSTSEALRAVDISHATMNRWVKAHAKLPPAESERILGVARLVGQIQAMVEESGEPEGFDARAWLTRWLGEPLAALGGTCPRDLLDTIEGQRMVSEALARMQSGAYA
jgi:putative toxin-antitoxin system antitoxin component (TIGR02293 family)